MVALLTRVGSTTVFPFMAPKCLEDLLEREKKDRTPLDVGGELLVGEPHVLLADVESSG